MHRRLFAIAVLAGVLAAFAGEAQALTFCAGLSGGDCTAAYPPTGDGVQQALTAADGNPDIGGSPNTVRIGPGTFTRAPGHGYLAGSPVIVVGQGPSTVLAASPSTANSINDVFRSTATSSTLRDLVVRATGRADVLVKGFTTVADVRVTGSADASFGVDLPVGARGSRLLVDLTVSQAFYGGVLLHAGSVLEDSVVRVRGVNTRGVVMSDSATTTPSTVRHVTILGDAESDTVGVVNAVFTGVTTPRVATVNVRDSIIRGVAIPLLRTGKAATAGCGCTTGTANLSVSYSSFDTTPGAGTDSGPGSFTLGPGNLNDPDPLFVDVAGGDLRLFAGSPLIDAGDPAAPEAGDSATDAGGSPRIANGRRDIGAFEGAVAVPVGAGPVAPPPGSSALDLTAPELASAKLSRTVFRVGATSTALTSARRRTPGRGTVVTYTLSEVAVVTFTVERRLGGRFVTRKGSSRRVCLRAKTRTRGPAGKRCTLRRTAGTLTRAAAAGRNALAFSGRIGRRKLPAGSYRMTLIARDAAGNSSRPARLAFRVVK